MVTVPYVFGNNVYAQSGQIDADFASLSASTLGAVSKTGDTMTGNLTAPGFTATGAYIRLNGSTTGGPGTAGGPFFYADAANILLHNGSSTGTFSVQNGNGGQMMFLDSAGAATFSGTVTTGGGIAIPTSAAIYFNGAPSGTAGTIIADTNNLYFRLPTGNGEYTFQNSSGGTEATIDQGGIGRFLWVLPIQGNNSGYCGSPTQAWAQVNAYGLNNLSDPRDKRDMAAAPDGALDKVKALPAIVYRHKDDADDAPLRTGFDVTALHAIHPDAVVMDEEGEHPRGYSLSDVNALLWQAVQELAAKVEALEKR